MDDISQRQVEILQAIINEFLGESTDMVASSLIVERYDIDACPATVRNEMARLEKLGLLVKPHISSGRVPSSIGIKYFLTHLLEEEKISVNDQALIKSKISSRDDDIYSLLSTSIDVLGDFTQELCFVFIGSYKLYKNIFKISKYRELCSTQVWPNILHLMENPSHIKKLAKNGEDNEVFVVVGEDMGYPELGDAVIIGKKFRGVQNEEGSIGIISSKRVGYPKVIPFVRFIGNIINESIAKWRW